MKATELSFKEKCYEVLKQVPQGKVTTYQEIAKALGSKANRAVGTAMAQNKKLIVIPCHRVVCSDGRIGQYVNGSDEKIALLRKEGVLIENGKVKDFSKALHRFN